MQNPETQWEYFQKADPGSFYLVLFSIPLGFYSAAMPPVLVSLREFPSYGLVSVGQAIVTLIGLVVFVWVLGWGVNGALVSLVVAGAGGLAVILVVLRRRHGLTWAPPSWQHLKDILSFGVRYYFGKVSNLVNFELGTLVLAFFASKDDIGLFSLGLAMADRVQMLPDSLTTVLLPRVAADQNGRVDLVARCTRVMTVVSGVALVGLAMVVQPLFALLVPKFLPAVVLIWILAPGVWIRCAGKLFVPYLHSQGRVGITSVAIVAGLLVNLGLLALLLPVLGLPAAAAAAVAGNYLVSSAILAAAFARCSGLSIWQAWCPRWTDLVWLWQEVAAYLRRLRATAAERRAARRPGLTR